MTTSEERVKALKEAARRKKRKDVADQAKKRQARTLSKKQVNERAKGTND